MRKAIFILLFFVIGCHHQTDDKTLLFLNDGIERCNGQIFQLNDRSFMDFEAFKAENPKKGIPIKNMVDLIKIKTQNIFKIIDLKKSEFSDKKIPNKNQIKKLDFRKSVAEYKNQLDSLFPNDSLIQFYLKNKLAIEESKSGDLNVSELNILKNKIQVINYFAMRNLNNKINEQYIRPNQYEVVLIPRTIYLYEGGKYEADIFLSAYDNKYQPIIIIGKDTLIPNNGKTTFTATRTDSIGNFAYNGRFEIKHRSNDEVITFPFKFNYSIVKKR